MTDTRRAEFAEALLAYGRGCAWYSEQVQDARFNYVMHLFDDTATAVQGGEWVMAPREPTYEMVQAGAKLVKDNLPSHTGTLAIYQAMLAAAPPAARQEEGKCVWTYDDDGFWNQGCDGAWSFTEGGPAENNCRFCPSCGKQIDAAMSGETKG